MSAVSLHWQAGAPFVAIAAVLSALLTIAVRENLRNGKTWDGHRRGR